MKKKSLFKRVSGVLTGVFFSTSLILAANENGQLFGRKKLIFLFFLFLFFFFQLFYSKNNPSPGQIKAVEQPPQSMSHFRIVVRFHWQPRLMKYWKKHLSILHSPSWTEIFSSYLYAFIIYPSINQNSSSALHDKDGKNIFLTRYLTPTIFQKISW